MITLVENTAKVIKCHNHLLKRLKPLISETMRTTVGFQGGKAVVPVRYSRKIGIWWATTKHEDKYWNVFGVGEPSKTRSNSITCEINYATSPPFSSRAGAFARDKAGKIILLHSGRIGGGRKGIGKSHFFDNYVGKSCEVRLSKKKKLFATVGALESDRFPYQLGLFVQEISRIKGMVGVKARSNPYRRLSKKFSKEFGGSKKYKTTSHVIAECDHGLVVNELQRLLTKLGIRAVNDPNIDLYVLDSKNHLKIVFEIKTDVTLQALYTAVGQLLFNSSYYGGKPSLLLVIPSRLPAKTTSILKGLGIQTVVYSWKNNRPIFKNFISMIRL